MQYTFIINGTAQLVLIPENELDRLLLQRTLEGGGSIEVEKISQPISIMGKPITDSIVLKRKIHSTQTALNKQYDTSET